MFLFWHLLYNIRLWLKKLNLQYLWDWRYVYSTNTVLTLEYRCWTFFDPTCELLGWSCNTYEHPPQLWTCPQEPTGQARSALTKLKGAQVWDFYPFFTLINPAWVLEKKKFLKTTADIRYFVFCACWVCKLPTHAEQALKKCLHMLSMH